jgi:hypothetical protein
MNGKFEIPRFFVPGVFYEPTFGGHIWLSKTPFVGAFVIPHFISRAFPFKVFRVTNIDSDGGLTLAPVTNKKRKAA